MWGQQLFLNGSNLAWVNYGTDWGLGTTDTATIGEWMIQMHQSGGNAMRVWLNVEGTTTPVFDDSGHCTRPVLPHHLVHRIASAQI